MKRTIDLEQLENLYKRYKGDSVDTLDTLINYLAGEQANSPKAFMLKKQWRRELAEERSRCNQDF